MYITRHDNSLAIHLPSPHRVMSWAIVGGGLRTAESVVWRCVDDLPPDVDPVHLLREHLHSIALPDAVALLTAANLDHLVQRQTSYNALRADALVTVGLSNALRVGDPPGGSHIGTINLLVVVSVPLTDEGLLEVLSIAAEARTVAVLEAGVPSHRSGAVASGTGTDCIVIAAPIGENPVAYAGKHTDLGHLVGDAVLRAVQQGVAAWIQRKRS